MESKKWSLNREDGKQIAIKLVMLVVALAIPLVLEEVQRIDFGNYQYVGTVIIFLLTYGGQRLGKGK
jgi:hypothetical protein